MLAVALGAALFGIGMVVYCYCAGTALETGTKLKCRPALKMSVDRGRPEVAGRWPNDANDPQRALDLRW
jgi:hypothetical protein